MKKIPFISRMSYVAVLFSVFILSGCTYAQMRVYNDPNSTAAQRQEVSHAGQMNLVSLVVFGVGNEQAVQETLTCTLSWNYQCENQRPYDYNIPKYNSTSSGTCTQVYNMALHKFECV